MASAIVNQYAQEGVMLALSVERLQAIAAEGLLAVAVTTQEPPEVIGTAGITFTYPDGTLEFGGWAVDRAWQHTGVGKHLLKDVLSHHTDAFRIIAFGNTTSTPIFTKHGATVLDQGKMHPDAFKPCLSCKCHGKAELPPGTLCVDSILDLSPILTTMNEKEAAKAESL